MFFKKIFYCEFEILKLLSNCKPIDLYSPLIRHNGVLFATYSPKRGLKTIV